MAKVDNGLSDASKGRDGEIIRDYVPKEGVRWRSGCPDYARVNDTYFKNRTKKPIPGSPEEYVTRLISNFEVDSQHVARAEDWITVDQGKFKASINGSQKVTAQALADIGLCNYLLQPLANGESSFTEGFAWECVEVYSGPPKVCFKWRRFGKYLGSSTDSEGNKYAGDGRMLELVGTCVATVNAVPLIEELEFFYNPDDMVMLLNAPELLSEPIAKPTPEPSDQGCSLM